MAGVSFVAFMVKVVFLIFVFMWVRWTLPRFRWDQLMRLGWRTLIPVALANILLVALWMEYAMPWLGLGGVHYVR